MSLLFSKTVFFLKNFVSLCLLQLIQFVFQSIKIVLKFLRKPLFASINPIYFSINRNSFKIFKRSLCLFRSIETDFRSIENHESGFLKSEFDLFKLTFQKVCQTSLSPNWTRLAHKFFVLFLCIFCKVFLSISR